MPTVTSWTYRDGAARDESFALVVSGRAGAEDTVTLTGFSPFRPHFFVGVVMFDESGAQIYASEGSFYVSALEWTTNTWTGLADNPISSESPEQISGSGPITGIEVLPLGVLPEEVDTYEVRIAFYAHAPRI